MGKTLETISTINSAVRTVLALVFCGAVGTGGMIAYNKYNEKEIAARNAEKKLSESEAALSKAKGDIAKQDARIQEQNTQIAEQIKRIEKLDTSLRLLKVDHRLARLDILDRSTDDAGRTVTKVEFIELNDEGQPLGKPRVFTLRGEQLYVDGRVVKFEDKYVEEADLLRSTSLFVFNRIFTDAQNPRDGFPLDEVGARPRAYEKGGVMTDFERKIWEDFWSIANDETKAKELGISAAHGEAVSIKPEKGISYRLQLRASGGLTIKPEGRVLVSPARDGA